jgi:uncharacterized protein (DUF3084 family)
VLAARRALEEAKRRHEKASEELGRAQNAAIGAEAERDRLRDEVQEARETEKAAKESLEETSKNANRTWKALPKTKAKHRNLEAKRAARRALG